MMWWYGTPWSGTTGLASWTAWHMIAAAVFWLLLLILGFVAVRWLINARRPNGEAESRRENTSAAIDIIEQRYARGEIGRDEYLAKKRDLVAPATP